jgi:hypothetical protein
VAHPDYEEFLAAFNEHGVRYLIGGAHALGFHARPRATKHLDIFFAPTSANARRAAAAVASFEKEHWRRAQDIADLEVLRRVRARPRSR